jgi:hypothetical protein
MRLHSKSISPIVFGMIRYDKRDEDAVRERSIKLDHYGSP